MLYRIDPEKLRDALITIGKGTSNLLAARGAFITNMVDRMIRGTDIPSWAEALPEPRKKQARGEGYSAAFNAFWEAYPSRGGVKSGKAPAYRAWQKAVYTLRIPEPALLDICLDRIAWQKTTEQWTEENGKYIPMATTYLNQRRFEDENPDMKTELETGANKMNWEEFK